MSNENEGIEKWPKDDFERFKEMMAKQPLQFYRQKDELTELQERWVGLIRNHGFKICNSPNGNTMPAPDLFDIANEIDAFFTALKLNHGRK